MPWTHLQIWNLDQWRRHDFGDSAVAFRRELEWVTAELARGWSKPLLPFEDDLRTRPANARLVLRWDGSEPLPAGLKAQSFGPQATATIADQGAPAPLAGPRLVADHQADGFWFPLTSDPAALPLRRDRTYFVGLDYWIIRDAETNGDWLTAGARTTAGGWQRDVGTRYAGGPAGTRGRLTLRLAPRDFDDYYLYISLHGAARIELDNLEIWEAE